MSHPQTKLTIPQAKPARPSRVVHWPHFIFWRMITPLHPGMRRLSARLGLIDFNQFLDGQGRQRFLLGTIAPEHNIDTIIEHLVQNGFGHNTLAWEDTGEVASLRLSDGFRFQYHVRIFSDGEVRGHYEFTPEAHPWKHYYEEGMVPEREYFEQLLGDRLTWA